MIVQGSLFIRAFTFAEGTCCNHQYFITGLIIPGFYGYCFSAVFVSVAVGFIPLFDSSELRMGRQTTCPFRVAALGYVFQYCMIGRANGPCSICEKICYVTLSDCFSHI